MWGEYTRTHSKSVLSAVSTHTEYYLTLAQSSTGILFGFSLITATIRTVVRFQTQRRLMVDDFMLMFGCLTLSASQIILYLMMEDIYWGEALILDSSPQTYALAIEDPKAFYHRILKYQQMSFSFTTLTWTTIFVVKFCFLLFFQQMIIRMERLMLAWKMVFGITLGCWAFCTCGIFISCPHFGLEACKSAILLRSILRFLNWLNCSGVRRRFWFHQEPRYRCHRNYFRHCVRLTQWAKLINHPAGFWLQHTVISIPVLLLWKVRIKSQQKIFLGIFLCLSICMIMIAIIKVSGLRIRKSQIDVQWEVFWQDVEATVAVIMVSITAFRSMIGMKTLKAREKRQRSWYSYRRKLLARNFRKVSKDETDIEQLPSIPRATLTGMRTFINSDKTWNNPGATGMTDASQGDWSGVDIHETHNIGVIQQISTE